MTLPTPLYNLHQGNDQFDVCITSSFGGVKRTNVQTELCSIVQIFCFAKSVNKQVEKLSKPKHKDALLRNNASQFKPVCS